MSNGTAHCWRGMSTAAMELGTLYNLNSMLNQTRNSVFTAPRGDQMESL